jgi:hypothetical protein
MKLLHFVAISAIVTGVIGFTTSVVAAGNVSVNRGACISNLATQGDQGTIVHQAPGQTGNGPLTIVSGTVIVSAGFDGGVGCDR